MSTPSTTAGQTKIFGVRIGVDPKILAGGLIVLTLLFVWLNLRGSDDDEHASNSGSAAAARPRPSALANRAPARRSNVAARDRGALSMKPVDPSRGDIDPTLRLTLLERLKGLQFQDGARNLFESGSEVAAGNLPPVPHGPIIPVSPLVPPVVPPTNAGPSTIPVNIPFKYYGFVKPAARGDANRGFFMEGDNVLVGIEGDVLLTRYLVVSLTPTSARIEDTQLKQGQDLAVSPEAVPQP